MKMMMIILFPSFLIVLNSLVMFCFSKDFSQFIRFRIFLRSRSLSALCILIKFSLLFFCPLNNNSPSFFGRSFQSVGVTMNVGEQCFVLSLSLNGSFDVLSQHLHTFIHANTQNSFFFVHFTPCLNVWFAFASAFARSA